MGETREEIKHPAGTGSFLFLDPLAVFLLQPRPRLGNLSDLDGARQGNLLDGNIELLRQQLVNLGAITVFILKDSLLLVIELLVRDHGKQSIVRLAHKAGQLELVNLLEPLLHPGLDDDTFRTGGCGMGEWQQKAGES